MKRITLTILATVMTFCGIQAQGTATVSTTDLCNPTTYLDKIMDHYGIKDREIMRREINPLTNRVKNLTVIMPFEQDGEHDDGLLSELIAQADSAFGQYVFTPSCYNFGKITPLTTHTGHTIYTGETTADKLTIIDDGEDANLCYMEVKESEDPTLRWFYGLKWTRVGSHLSGTVYIILSKRPDLIEQESLVRSYTTTVSSEATSDEEIMETIDEATRRKMTVLDRLLKQYDDEQKDLYGHYRTAYNLGNAELRGSIAKQITALMKKRQEALDELHKIAMTIK
ncbi:MAG: hypothetical protein Q4A08_01075 [Bacteroidales bacterium]|nr:hypothetical protein [Bacteroidales bacterium]